MSYQHLFFDDYSEGAHPRILAALAACNLQQDRGYGADAFTAEAHALIKAAMQQPEAAIHFVATGTQANIVCLAAMLKPFESVIAENNGHIYVHETGAIEATGHKINCVTGEHGKLTVAAIHSVLDQHAGDLQMVKPKVVYISQPTELGTMYSLAEIQTLYRLCQQHDLYLYIDGARLGHALASHAADFDLADLAAHCDMFYIGGTKNGALMGEAIVILNPLLQKDFSYHLRQRGALLAKARSVSVQFAELFRDNLYTENAAHANRMAQQLAAGMRELGLPFMHETSANQLFPILSDHLIEQLKTRYGFYVWCRAEQPGHSVIRLVTSWATPETAVADFLQVLKTLLS